MPTQKQLEEAARGESPIPSPTSTDATTESEETQPVPVATTVPTGEFIAHPNISGMPFDGLGGNEVLPLEEAPKKYPMPEPGKQAWAVPITTQNTSKIDETLPGGKFLVRGVWVNSSGHEIDPETGRLRFPEQAGVPAL